jgi:hypothetical protein
MRVKFGLWLLYAYRFQACSACGLCMDDSEITVRRDEYIWAVSRCVAFYWSQLQLYCVASLDYCSVYSVDEARKKHFFGRRPI